MSFLKNLHRVFFIGARELPSSEEEISTLAAFATRNALVVPDEYLALIREASEIELVVGGRGCIRIWSAAGTVEMNEGYNVQNYLPEALAIGDDEGGKAFAIMKGEHGLGLYRFPFSDPDRKEAVYIAGSIGALLVDGQGANRLFDWDEEGG